MEENKVHIVDWPKEKPLELNHSFKDDLGMDVNNWPKMPLDVHMNMLHNEGKPIPVCIKVCEPICARSSYKIGINLMGQPFAEIILNGITTLFNCREEKIDETSQNKDETIVK